ncbi:MAG: hypothetical protein ABIV48_06410 [Pyrinomonadaceae bacterium]
MFRKSFAACLAVFLFISTASAQKAEVTIVLNEAFFDALLESVFQNFEPPEFTLADHDPKRSVNDLPQVNLRSYGKSSLFVENESPAAMASENSPCSESVKILREMNGVRTAVRFRDGKIVVPLAFSGNYAPPFFGCVDFAGVAETNIELAFEQNTQRLVGRAKVLNVNLNGTGGLGGTIIAKLIQTSIDKKLNPIEILNMEKLSIGIPVQRSGNLRMRAVNVRPEIGNGQLNVRVDYQFVKE